MKILTLSAGVLALAGVLAFAVHAQTSTSSHALDDPYEPGYRLFRMNGAYVKWGDGPLGRGADLRYHVLSGPDVRDGGGDCPRLSGVEPLLKSTGLSRRQFDGLLQNVLLQWQRAANVKFIAVPDPTQADVVLGVQTRPEGWAYTYLRASYVPSEPVGKIAKAFVCLNPEQPWLADRSRISSLVLQPGVSLPSGFLSTTFAHEFGHVLGLDHSPFKDAVMASPTEAEELHQADIRGVRRLYGASMLAQRR